MFTKPRQLSLIVSAILAAGAFGMLGSTASAQTAGYDYQAPPVYPPQSQTAPLLSDQEIDQLTAPIALYPDPLLAQILPASTYPEDVAGAAGFVKVYGQPNEDTINAQPWDPSVKAIVHYPSVLMQLATNMDWTQALGAAFINQPQDVMNSIQRLRAEAQAAGSLATNQQQQVIADAGNIEILPANPDVVYVPQYDPGVVYVQPAPIIFGNGFPLGGFLDLDFDWGHHWITRGHHRHWERDGHRDGHIDRRPEVTIHPWVRDNRRAAPVLPPRYFKRAPVVRPGYEHPAPAPSRAFGVNEQRQQIQREQERGRQSMPQTPRPAPIPIRPAPAPRPVAPAPRPMAPAPRVEAPAPRRVAPAPRPVAPAPRVEAPAPRAVAPAPRVMAPAPRAVAPAPAFRPGNPAGISEDSARGRQSMHR